MEDGPHEVCSISYWIPGNHSESLLYGPRETIQERRQRVIQAWNFCGMSQVRMQDGDDLPAGLRRFGHDCTLSDLKEAVLKAKHYLVHRPMKMRHAEGPIVFANLKPCIIALANLLPVYQAMECE